MITLEIPFVKGKRVRVKSKEFGFIKTGYPYAGQSGTVVGIKGLFLEVEFDSGVIDTVGYETLSLI